MAPALHRPTLLLAVLAATLAPLSVACTNLTGIDGLSLTDCPKGHCRDRDASSADDDEDQSSSSSSGTSTPKTDSGSKPSSDGGTSTDAAADAAPAQSYVVFVTSATFTGKGLGGLAGADAQCQAAANAAKLGTGPSPVFRAWLSSSATTVDARLTHKGPYKLVTGALVAANFDKLKSGSIETAIDTDEVKGTHADLVWTGTTTAGVTASRQCDAWTNSGEQGGAGSAASSLGQWTDTGPLPCSSLARLYCFEQ
jgi:hypothetical protein